VCSSLALSTAAAINAAITPLLNYQGHLTDASGNPVADGGYDLTFRIYDAASGGTQLWSSGSSPTTVNVVNGLFFVILGTGGNALPQGVFSGQTLYLGIQLDGEPEFSPRRPIVATAYSLRANVAESAADADRLGGEPASSFLNTSGATMTGALQFDSESNGLDIFLGQSGDNRGLYLTENTSSRASLSGYSTGAELRLYDGDTDLLFFGQASDASGGELQLDKGDGSNGIYLGAGGSSESAVLELQGANIGRVTMDGGFNRLGPSLSFMDSTGVVQVEVDLGQPSNDAMVSLPSESINGNEIKAHSIGDNHIAPEGLTVASLADDAGGTQLADGTNSVTLTGALQVIAQQDITVPESGYVLAITSCQVTYLHVTGTTSSAAFGVSRNDFSFPNDQGKDYMIDGNAATGIYHDVITVQKMLIVGSGTSTIYFLGDKGTGTSDPVITDITLSLLYFKTSYGSFSEQ
jgi:hypothetical protein